MAETKQMPTPEPYEVVNRIFRDYFPGERFPECPNCGELPCRCAKVLPANADQLSTRPAKLRTAVQR